jgi:GDP-L-fucose synthase
MAGFLDFRYRFDAARPSGYPKRVMDITRAREWTGWQPATSLADGLKATWDWYCAHEDEYLLKQNYFLEGRP